MEVLNGDMQIELDKIYNEDCLIGMKQIPDGTIDAVICDLPYGTTACAWDSVIPFDKLWEQYHRICKPNAAVVLFGSEPFSTLLRMSNLKEFKYDWIWDKVIATGMTLAKYQPMKEHEIISVFGRGRVSYYPIMESLSRPRKYKCYAKSDSQPLAYNDEQYRTCDEKYPKSIISVSNANHTNQLHPTQKPVDLLRYLVLTYTNEGDTVLDNCSGSGTTAVACVKEKRHFICFEKDETYWKKSVERVKNEQRQLSLF